MIHYVELKTNPKRHIQPNPGDIMVITDKKDHKWIVKALPGT